MKITVNRKQTIEEAIKDMRTFNKEMTNSDRRYYLFKRMN